VATTLDPDALRAEVEAARQESQQGRPARAVTRYRRLRTRIERSADPRAEVGLQRVRVVLGLAAAEYELTGDLDAAMTLLDEAETLTGEVGAESMRAPVRGQRGLLLLRSGRSTDALRSLDRAVEVMALADASDQFSILLNRGVLHLDAGSLDAASADFTEAVELAQRSGDLLYASKARHNLGYVDFLAGRIPRALAAMEEAGRGDENEHPVLLLDRARVLREAGLAHDAEELLARAATEFRAAGLHQDLAETDLVRAECALVEGEADRARQLARAAERIFVRRRNVQWQRKAQLLVLQCERLTIEHRPERGRRSALRQLGARARRLAEDCRAEKRVDLARPAELLARECVLRAGGEVGEAGTLSPAMRASDPLPSRLLTREVRALVALHRDDRVRAAAEVRRGLAELGSYQNGFGSLDLRTASAVHGLPLARLGLELAEHNGSAAEFFAAVERGRAISIRLASVGPPRDERTADLLAALRQTEEEARGLEGDPAAGEALARLRTHAGSLQRDIRARAWELEGGAEVGAQDSARVAETRAAARAAGTAFVTYVVHRGRWTAVTASARRPALVDLAAAADVDELVQRVRADLDALAMPFLPPPLTDSVRRSLDAGLRRLDDLLLAPVGVEGQPIVVSCSAALVLLPWSLLPSRRGLPVVVTPSATAWLRAGDHVRRTQPRVVSVAGPGLHRAEDEARRVHALWAGAELLTGAAATTESLRLALAGADVVHVAAHGTHQQESPLFSSLRVSDGPLYAYELDAGDQPAPCVVLSACEAGLATVRPGDEGLGLTSVLLHLGSRSVLAGVARVRDDVAARVMQRAHASMAAGTSSAQALAGALADEEEPAPFVAFGATW
jgi:tetratricopeptide (TPR) repeat protein